MTPPSDDPPAPLSGLSTWFSEEVQPHDAQLKGYLRGSFPAVRDVDDLVQESYLRVWKTRAARPVACARALLFQIARRLAIDAIRHDRASPFATVATPGELCVPSEEPDTGEAVDLRERKRQLVEAVAALPARYREIVILCKFEGLARRDVAQRLGLSERTVENLLARAIRKCEDRLRRRGVLHRHNR